MRRAKAPGPWFQAHTPRLRRAWPTSPCHRMSVSTPRSNATTAILAHTHLQHYHCASASSSPLPPTAPHSRPCPGRYLRIATPALYLSCVSSCLYRYLVTQQEVRPSTLCTIITAALCPFYNWLLIYKWVCRLSFAFPDLFFPSQTTTWSRRAASMLFWLRALPSAIPSAPAAPRRDSGHVVPQVRYPNDSTRCTALPLHAPLLPAPPRFPHPPRPSLPILTLHAPCPPAPRYKMGLDGGAWAFVLSTGTYSLLLLVYTCVRDARRAARRHPQHTWPGFSWRALEGWASYLHYALPAAAMICMEWWIFECVIFMAGAGGVLASR